MGNTQRRAVIIGINEYENANRLAGCVRDARELAEVLSLEEYGYESALLVDEGATRRDCLVELWDAAETDGASLIIYFAGHGGLHGKSGYLHTYDGVARDPGIDLQTIAEISAVASGHYDHVLTILDACHSGAGDTWSGHSPLTASAVSAAIQSVNSSRLLLAACRPEQVAFETSGPDVHGEFTRVLLDALMGDAVDFDGNVTAHTLFDVVTGRMDTQRQTPVFKGDSAGSVVLGRGFEPRIGEPLRPQATAALLAKGEQFLDEYQLLQSEELSRLDRRRNGGLDACARSLAQIIHWFDDVEISQPDVKRESEWKGFRRSLTNHQAALSAIDVGDTLPLGRVASKVGAGGFGQVWELESQGATRLAFKAFHGSELTDGEKPQRFRNGYRSMKKLDHPRIVSVHELIEAPLGFSMDYINGADLSNAFVDRTDGGRVLSLCFEIADTVRFAHDAGIIHRDIKPENVILAWDDETQDTVPHLTDFDLAYIQTNRTVTKAAVGGVVHYAAPEQFYSSGPSSRAHTVDVYGLGQLIFFLYVASDPSADRPEQNMERFARAVASLHTQTSAALIIELYRSCSQYKPEDRPQSLEEVCTVLTSARVAHNASSSVAELSESDVCREVAFVYAGHGAFSEDGENGIFMTSRAGTLTVQLRARGVPAQGRVDFSMTLDATQSLGVSGTSSGAQGRLVVNQRLDRRLQKFEKVTRTPGTSGYFQTHLHIMDRPLNSAGVAELVEVLSAAIGAIEQVD
ncbi:serine/threonine protein kinase [Frigoribacterium sp. PvP054]|uniref:protein kinase domain-containing protein n=1 Tax=Frigoribacterium sp. PvP054 TaxID=3156438 RepID=UPI003398FADA